MSILFIISVSITLAVVSLVNIFTVLGESESAPGRTFRVSSISELQSRINSAIPGDRIIVANGVYTTTRAIKVAGKGTAARPIVIAAQTTGGVEIEGMGGFDLESPASYVVIKGFKFTHAAGTVQVRAGTYHPLTMADVGPQAP